MLELGCAGRLVALVIFLPLLAACGESTPGDEPASDAAPVDSGPADATPDGQEPPDAATLDAAPDGGPASCGEDGACSQGEVCCGAPLPCEGRCVPDCRLGRPCPNEGMICNEETGLCEPGEPARVSTLELTVRNPTSGIDWWAKAFYPEDGGAENQYPAVISVPPGSGAGSDSEDAEDPSRSPAVQAEAGFVVVIFDPDGRGNTEGGEDDDGFTHQDGLAALVLTVADLPFVDGERIGISTASYGITMGSGVLARYPELPVQFLLDVEGPADRDDTGHCDESDTGHLDHDCEDDTWWSEREAATFMTQVQVPYLRLQNARDHAQPDNLHAILMIDSATDTAFGGQGISPWTRVNSEGMNPPNTVYSEEFPPVYNDNTPFDLPALWTELFALN
ncbi:MAG: hypothetical protein HYY06_14035 [Deltaproteobacteria bacterium]|nr:hypothetical protein [Deltaproteobacteria bacterium]